MLSPPNVIHLVLTVRDCVMVEERRLSLMFLDEVGVMWVRGAQGKCVVVLRAFVGEERGRRAERGDERG